MRRGLGVCVCYAMASLRSRRLGMFFEHVLKCVHAMRRRLGGLGVCVCYVMVPWRVF